jgi:hypothetical protein
MPFDVYNDCRGYPRTSRLRLLNAVPAQVKFSRVHRSVSTALRLPAGPMAGGDAPRRPAARGDGRSAVPEHSRPSGYARPGESLELRPDALPALDRAPAPAALAPPKNAPIRGAFLPNLTTT